jgi:hypothetical protein
MPKQNRNKKKKAKVEVKAKKAVVKAKPITKAKAKEMVAEDDAKLEESATIILPPTEVGVESVETEKVVPVEPSKEPQTDVTESMYPLPSEEDSASATVKNKGKKAIEKEAREENLSENEKTEDISSVPSESETTTVSEESKPSDITEKDCGAEESTDSEESTTTNNDEVENLRKEYGGEVPYWLPNMIRNGWLKAHGTVEHPNGGNIELHANHGFDKYGRTIEIAFDEVKRPDTTGMSKAEKDEARADFNKRVEEVRSRNARTRVEYFRKFENMLPSLLHMHLKTVHCWNKRSEKELNITGILVGLQGGKSPYTVLVDGFDKDGNPKKIRKGFRNVSPTLPEGITATETAPLRNATDVEKEVDTKLLTDKSAEELVFPKGYEEALSNLKSGVEHNTILVWNQDGDHLAFWATPNYNSDNERDGFKWVSLDMSEGGYIKIHNSAILMKGSVQELLRVTGKVNQKHIDNMLYVSIPVKDTPQMEEFIGIL